MNGTTSLDFSGFEAFVAVSRAALGLCPVAYATESVAAFLTRLDTWKAQGEWVPASGGTEKPFTTRSGRTLLYCWQPRSGNHAYLDCGTDTFLTNEEASNILCL